MFQQIQLKNSTTTDASVSSGVRILKSLPHPMISPAVIQNPTNENEILIFAAQEETRNIYIYNQTTDKFTINTATLGKRFCVK